MLVRRLEHTWYEGRAAAESARSLAWRYAVAGEPFGTATENVDGLFLRRLREILTDLEIALDVGPDAGDQITPAMRKLRKDSLTQRRDAYCAGRIEDQREWYQSEARWNAARAKRLRLQAIALELGGVVASILTITGTLRVDLLGIFAAASAGVVAWLQTKQHETLSRAYSISAQELAGVRSEWEGVQEVGGSPRGGGMGSLRGQSGGGDLAGAQAPAGFTGCESRVVVTVTGSPDGGSPHRAHHLPGGRTLECKCDPSSPDGPRYAPDPGQHHPRRGGRV